MPQEAGIYSEKKGNTLRRGFVTDCPNSPGNILLHYILFENNFKYFLLYY
jgi:hypothetical protein